MKRRLHEVVSAARRASWRGALGGMGRPGKEHRGHAVRAGDDATIGPRGARCPLGSRPASQNADGAVRARTDAARGPTTSCHEEVTSLRTHRLAVALASSAVLALALTACGESDAESKSVETATTEPTDP